MYHLSSGMQGSDWYGRFEVVVSGQGDKDKGSEKKKKNYMVKRNDPNSIEMYQNLSKPIEMY